MVSLEWCKKQKRGVELVQLNNELGKSYLDDAYESLKVSLGSSGKWKIVTAYYSCYDALYSILIKCGIKSEIHDCTIKLMELFNFSDEEIRFLKELKQDRINSQYYRMKVSLDNFKRIKSFILKCEGIFNLLDEGKINRVRKLINKEANIK